MRPSRLLVVLILALAATGCMRRTAPPVAVAPGADLDHIIYGTRVAQPAPMRAPAVVPARAQIAVPVAAVPVAAVPAPVVAVAPHRGPVPVAMVTGDIEEPYGVDTGDKLRIVVFGQDGLTNSYTVDAAGNVTMPLIGSVAARSLTTQQLARAIAERLRGGFIREPHVAIEVETYRPFFILGEVTTPGQYAYVPKMTAETAVAIAGGYTPRAYRGQVKLTRSVGGQIVRTTVPLLTRLRPGDTIMINERWF
jgi:polysaccharide export outer membrane protein